MNALAEAGLFVLRRLYTKLIMQPVIPIHQTVECVVVFCMVVCIPYIGLKKVLYGYISVQ